MTGPTPLSILAPRLPDVRDPQPFPLIAAVAPVLMGLAIFAMTKSTLALVFVALGPLIAIGSMVDSRLQSRRLSRRESVRFEGELAAARAELAAAHESERARLEREHPPAVTILAGARAGEWMPGAAVPRLRLGHGSAPSRVTIDGVPALGRGRSPDQLRLGAFIEEASRIRGAPLVVEAERGIGVVSTGVAGGALVRALVVQLAARLSPVEWSVRGGLASESWIAELPHAAEPGESGTIEFVHTDGDVVRVVLVGHREDLPREIAVVVEERGIAVSFTSDDQVVAVDALERLSRAEASDCARRLRREALERGFDPGRSRPPARVTFADLDRWQSRGLAAVVGHDGESSVGIDLIGDGPHAIVGGTSGSGKSELLVTWILSLAAANAPTEVSFLLVDFKGGASFGAVAQLPHCVGLVTDLDARASERAFESIAAEVRHRERELARQGVRDIASATGLPRLVIVVDEFATLATEFPHLHGLFGDLAARGRSLGIHLILCTQRPSGVVRDAVLANVGVRISLRVNDRADSLAVIGSAQAAAIPASARGRGYLAEAGRESRLIQVAIASDADIERVAAQHSGATLPRRPWRDPLPLEIDLASLTDDGAAIVLGIADHPSEQSQPIARWHPAADGSLIVIGAAGSGKSSALATIAHSARPRRVEVVRGDPLAAWDLVTRAIVDIRCGTVAGDRILVIDDLDVVLDRLDAEHSAGLVEHVQSVLREGGAAGIHCVLSVQRVTGALQSVLSLCGSRLLLRLADRQEHVFAGGTSTDFAADLAPGRGWWRGRPVHLASGAPAPALVEARVEHVDGAGGPLAIVSTRPDELVTALSRLGATPAIVTVGAETLAVSNGESGILMGDPDEWQSLWGAVARVRRHRALIVHGCSMSEFRALTRQRVLPPPLAARGGQFWLLHPGGEAVRAAIAPRAFASDSAQFSGLDPRNS